jgi:hypothetical protein
MAHCAHRIETEIHRAPEHMGIPRNEEADHQANNVGDNRGNTVWERISTLAKTRSRRICERRTAAKAQWKANKCFEHSGYRLNGKAGSK